MSQSDTVKIFEQPNQQLQNQEQRQSQSMNAAEYSKQKARKVSVFSQNGFQELHQLDQQQLERRSIDLLSGSGSKSISDVGTSFAAPTSAIFNPNNSSIKTETYHAGSSTVSADDANSSSSRSDIKVDSFTNTVEKYDRVTSPQTVSHDDENNHDLSKEKSSGRQEFKDGRKSSLATCATSSSNNSSRSSLDSTSANDASIEKVSPSKISLTSEKSRSEVSNTIVQASRDASDESRAPEVDDSNSATPVKQSNQKLKNNIPPPFKSIGAQLSLNSKLDAQSIQQHIDRLISQNEAIVDNWNFVGIRSYNPSQNSANATSSISNRRSGLVADATHDRRPQAQNVGRTNENSSKSKRSVPSKRWSTTAIGNYSLLQEHSSRMVPAISVSSFGSSSGFSSSEGLGRLVSNETSDYAISREKNSPSTSQANRSKPIHNSSSTGQLASNEVADRLSNASCVSKEDRKFNSDKATLFSASSTSVLPLNDFLSSKQFSHSNNAIQNSPYSFQLGISNFASPSEDLSPANNSITDMQRVSSDDVVKTEQQQIRKFSFETSHYTRSHEDTIKSNSLKSQENELFEQLYLVDRVHQQRAYNNLQKSNPACISTSRLNYSDLMWGQNHVQDSNKILSALILQQKQQQCLSQFENNQNKELAAALQEQQKVIEQQLDQLRLANWSLEHEHQQRMVAITSLLQNCNNNTSQQPPSIPLLVGSTAREQETGRYYSGANTAAPMPIIDIANALENPTMSERYLRDHQTRERHLLNEFLSRMSQAKDIGCQQDLIKNENNHRLPRHSEPNRPIHYSEHGTELLTQSMDGAKPAHKCEACDIYFWTKDLLSYHSMTQCTARTSTPLNRPFEFSSSNNSSNSKQLSSVQKQFGYRQSEGNMMDLTLDTSLLHPAHNSQQPPSPPKIAPLFKQHHVPTIDTEEDHFDLRARDSLLPTPTGQSSQSSNHALEQSLDSHHAWNIGLSGRSMLKTQLTIDRSQKSRTPTTNTQTESLPFKKRKISEPNMRY